MMFWFCKKNTDVESFDEAELRERIKQLETEVNSFKKVLEKINGDIPSSSFAFDFKNVNVFSIERNVSENRPVTVIGYLLPEPFTTEENGVVTKDTVREWYLYCNQEQHEKLVEEFKKSLK